MKCSAFVLLFAIALPASANLVTYNYESRLFQQPPKSLYPFGNDSPTGSFTFDTEALALTAFSIDFGDSALFWSGHNALTVEIDIYGQVTAAEPIIQLDGDFSVSVAWEASSQPGTLPGKVLGNFIEYVAPDTMPVLYWYSPDLRLYTLFMDRSRITEAPAINLPVPVPEPATLSLLALGLAAIGIRRRVTARLR